MASEEANDYQLSRVIDAHKDDVKAVQSTSEGLIISGGRDFCFRFWAKKGGEFTEISSFPQTPSVHVNSLGYFEGNGDWRLFAGRRDGSITVYGPGSTAEKPLHTLVLHEQNVACLFVDEKHEIVMTGSWDKTCAVFSIKDVDKESPPFLRLVSQAQILAVHSLPEKDLYLTAGSDKIIRQWKRDSEMRQFIGHTDVVRALLVQSNERFISASNDSTIRIWDFENGTCIGKFSSNFDQYIYSLTSIGDKLITTSEGGCIEIWEPQAGNKLAYQSRQILKTPAQSIWDACVMDNGDLVTAGSDGRIYIWTTNEKRKAPQMVVEALDAALAAQAAKEAEIAEKQAGGRVVIKVALDDGAPSLELVYEKGTDPAIAAEKFIMDNNLPTSYLSEIIEYIKANIPEARAAAAAKLKPQETQRVLVDGELWDYAFDISADDGRKLRLCYNLGEDVDYAAQRFVEKHNLPMKFLVQISSFLRQQMSEAGVASGYKDPLTGESSYVPFDQNTLGGSAAGDPFTGEGRYVPSSSVTPMDTTAGDPLTSGGRYVPGSVDSNYLPNASRIVDKKKPRSEYCPLTQFYFFGVEQLSQKAKDKLKEVNATQTSFQLNEAQISALEEIMCPDPKHVNLEILISAIDMGLQWNIQDILPIIDVFRIVLLHAELNKVFCDVKGRGSETHQRLTSLLVSEPSDAVCAVLCRAISNAFSHSWGQEMLMQNVEFTTTVIAQKVLHQKPVVQLAASTALANWSYLLLQQSEKVAELGPREDLIRVIVKVFENEISFGGRSEVALVRLMQAMATLMWGDAAVIKLAKQRNLHTIVNRIKDGVIEESSKGLARDIVEMTNSVEL